MASTPSTFPRYPDLHGKVALITGIGQSGAVESTNWGNGAAVARILSTNGCAIFGCDLFLEAAQRTQSRLLEDRPDASIDVVACDVTNLSAVEGMVKQCLEKHGKIDILINNVGRSEPGDPASMSPEVWDRQMDVNLKTVYNCCHTILPFMEKQGAGSIVNVASIVGQRYAGKPQVAYAATKAAIIQFTKHTAVIYAARGVRMNVVVPGLIDTPLVQVLADKYAGGDYEGFRKTRDAQVPTGKMGTGFDVANAVAFLCSDNAAGYITGVDLVVDGGITLSTGRT